MSINKYLKKAISDNAKREEAMQHWKSYTGVGSRKTPVHILKVMESLAMVMELQGYVLRSGGAEGADKAFEQGTSIKQIFYATHANSAAMEIASKYHPAWDKCSQFAKKLHARNTFQVLGSDLDKPSEFLVCWTPDGCTSHKTRSQRTGGTGTAISIADAYKVKVYNLRKPDHLTIINSWIEEELNQ